MSYQKEITAKVEHLERLLEPYYTNEIDVFPSKPNHYRQRVEFRIWHDDQGPHYAMTKSGEKTKTDTIIYTPQLPQAAADINAMMPLLLQAIKQSNSLTHRLFQIEFLTTLNEDMLVTMIYHRPLDEAWQQQARALADSLNINIIGRARKQKLVLTREYVRETLNVAGKLFHYHQYEGGFSQPNAQICQTMLNWAAEKCEQYTNSDTDLLELYCGNGNFTLPLAQYFRRVLATEISKTSVKAMKENIALNATTNVKVARLSAQEFNEAYRGVRTFRRLQQDKIDVKQYDFSTIFVDPPRAGIDSQTLTMMQAFEHIIYVSCNPQTLVKNLAQLTTTHQVLEVALFDQFPGTPHIECGVILSKSLTKKT